MGGTHWHRLHVSLNEKANQNLQSATDSKVQFDLCSVTSVFSSLSFTFPFSLYFYYFQSSGKEESISNPIRFSDLLLSSLTLVGEIFDYRQIEGKEILPNQQSPSRKRTSWYDWFLV